MAILLLLSLPSFCLSQNTEPPCQIKGAFVQFTTDQLQQVYTIDDKNEIKKFLPNCQEQFFYNNNRLGKIGSFDVSNPLHPMIFYPELQTLILLDRTLSPTAEVSLLNWDIIQASCAALAVDNNLWVYDEVAFILKKVNQEGKTMIESPNLSLVFNQPPKPIQILARDNFVYLNDPEQGIIIFDRFGQYQKTIDIKGVKQFELLNDQMVLSSEDGFWTYSFKRFQLQQLDIPILKDARQVSIQKGMLFFLNANGVSLIKV